jgi:3-oxoadipate enol-lactonase
MEPLVEPTLGRWFTAPFRQAHPERVDPVAAMIRRTPPRGYAGCCAAISALDLTDRISAIAVPTLVVVGEDDPGTPVAASEVIRAKIRGARLVVLKAAAHLSNIEQPETFTRALLEFLDGVKTS